ncbi:MAG TPA: sulfite exporter TauE/SafE family protein [Vicinamibacterales bacterium]|nr:sulfite exporter TauE/SafE family protein [Vicinamibacterales bacterium]
MSDLWVLAAGAAVAGLVQGISGFAFAMVAMAIWVWTINPELAAVMAVFGGLTGQIISVIRVRRGWHLSILWPFVGGSAIGIPLGTRLLPLLDANRFKLVLGSLLVVCCSAMLATARLPRVTRPRVTTGGRVADGGVGVLGGMMAPLSGFSGLAPALWCTLRGYSKDEHRAVLQNFNLIVLGATFASLLWTGRAHAGMATQMAVVAGSLVVPSIWGSKIYIGLSPAAFRNGVLWLLVLAGVTMIAAALRNLALAAA